MHCPPELLDDLAPLLAEVRTWIGVIEEKPNVFYLRGQPLLHFHLRKTGQRRGDVKGRDGWAQFDLPRSMSAAGRRAFLREVRVRFEERGERSRGATSGSNARPRGRT